MFCLILSESFNKVDCYIALAIIFRQTVYCFTYCFVLSLLCGPTDVGISGNVSSVKIDHLLEPANSSLQSLQSLFFPPEDNSAVTTHREATEAVSSGFICPLWRREAHTKVLIWPIVAQSQHRIGQSTNPAR
jgi:hypothetical protein